jgi:SAM-dependent methyltransferase
MNKTPIDRLHDYLVRAKNLYDRDSELQKRYSSADSEEFLRFIDTEGVIYFQELSDASFPFPPWTEMLTVGGETDIRKFLSIGYACFNSVFRCITPDNRKRKILDFGVGCARTMRFFYRYLDKFECYGCDVDKKSIEYLNKSMPFIDAYSSNTLPKLKYHDDFFDIIFCISVFTHFNKDLFETWMGEMYRIMKKGGIFIFSLHGTTAYNIISRESDRRRMIGINDEEFEKSKIKYKEEGFIWVPQPVGSSDIDTKTFGINFLDETRIKEIIPDCFEIIDYKKGELGGWQDLVVVRKK